MAEPQNPPSKDGLPNPLYQFIKRPSTFGGLLDAFGRKGEWVYKLGSLPEDGFLIPLIILNQAYKTFQKVPIIVTEDHGTRQKRTRPKCLCPLEGLSSIQKARPCTSLWAGHPSMQWPRPDLESLAGLSQKPTSYIQPSRLLTSSSCTWL